jgi:hypothetical protein
MMFLSVIKKLSHTRKCWNRSSSSFRINEVHNIDVDLVDSLMIETSVNKFYVCITSQP